MGGTQPTDGPAAPVADENPASDRASPESLPGAGSLAPAPLAPFDPDADPGATTALVETVARGPLSAAQADAVARMVVQGRPLQLIAMAVGRTPESLRRMVSGSLRPKIDEVRALVLRETSAHWFEMLAMLPQARQNMQAALLSTDESVRVSMSKWLHERIVPAPTQTQEVEHTVHFGAEVTELLTAMNDRFNAIDTAQAGRDPLARVRTGPEALRRAVTVLPNTATGDGAPDAA